MKKKDNYNTKLGQISRNNESFWKPLFKDYLSSKETLGTLSDKLGLDTRTIRNIFEDFEWIKSETTHIKTKLGYISKEGIKEWKPFHDMYMSGKSYEEVANYLGIQRKVLCKYFNLFEFEKRSMSDSCKLGISKMKKTCNEKFGVDFPTQSKEVKDKVKKTVIDKYSVDNVAKVPEIKQKAIISNRSNLDKRMLDSLSNWRNYLKSHNYTFLDNYMGVRDTKRDNLESEWVRYDIRHEDCGTVFKGYLHVDGVRCPKCYPKQESLKELNLFNLVNDNTEFKVVRNYPILDGKHIDIYIPELKIGFEYNGTIWHSSKYNKNKSYHRDKTELALDKGIKLYHIWEHDNEDIIKSIIKFKLNKSSEKYYARKLSVREVDTNSERNFLEKNHLKGYASSSVCLGLYNNEELVSLMSFKKCEDSYELLRFCCKLETSIVGGFSRLLDKFKKLNLTKKLFSYAYRDWTPNYKDSTYFKNGFRFVEYTQPSLCYYSDKNKKIYSRQKLMKYKLRELFPKSYSESKTAEEILLENNIYSVHNSGNLRFELDI